ncbi:MAG: mechanosensitive ion channel family protein [Verrucomicrobiota bacterium]
MMEMIRKILVSMGVTETAADETAVVVVIVLIAIGAFAVYWILRNYLLKLIHKVTLKTSNKWDDALMEARVFHRFLRLIPLTFIMLCIDRAMPDSFVLLKRILFALIIFVGARAVEAFLNAVADIYRAEPDSHRKPIRPMIQSLIILLYLFASIFIISVLINKEPWHLFTLLGGLTAVTMLVFKDTILGFVAGIQLGAYDMVREGDWIEMPKYGADGDVIEVTVNTVKVRNWDKTISTIPTYALISDSFKNWRGMSESGGRRIKRSIHIDMNTVRFADEAMLAGFRKMEMLKEYVEMTQQAIDSENEEKKIDLSATVVNGRRQTNLGIFRAYLVEYLRNHPKIHTGMTFLVRHLQPTPQGLPIEIYVFSSDKAWANYEAIQADIFDHVIAAIPEFGLRVFQQPSGTDITALKT